MYTFNGAQGEWSYSVENDSVLDDKGFQIADTTYPYAILNGWEKQARHWGEKKGITCRDISMEETMANGKLMAFAKRMLDNIIAQHIHECDTDEPSLILAEERASIIISLEDCLAITFKSSTNG